MEPYEELEIEVIAFDAEDVITTSGEGGGEYHPAWNPGEYEDNIQSTTIPVNF